MPKKIIIDIETRSACDLQDCGSYVYAEHPTTTVTFIGYKIDDQPIQVWRPCQAPMPEDLLAGLSDTNVILAAHNFRFERDLLTGPPGRAIGMPVEAMRPLERWSCTAARARRIGLPGELGRLAEALKFPPELQKDAVGHRLMLQVSKPRRNGAWWEDDTRMTRMAEYNVNDVRTEDTVDQTIPEHTPAERDVWLLTERMNDRAVGADRALQNRAADLIEEAQALADEQMWKLTDGVVPKVSDHAKLTQWLNSLGVPTNSVAKDAVQDLLDQGRLASDDKLHDRIRKALELRRDAGGTAISKVPAIARHLAADDRIHGALVYCGATATGRWSSNGVQLQNLPRHDKRRFKGKIPALLREVAAGTPLAELVASYGPPLKIAAELIRPMLIAAPGHLLVRGDLAQIEARVLSWFAGADWRLDAFRSGVDLYLIAASNTYGETITDDKDPRRDVGKVQELAFGYGGGVAAFKKMARLYNLKKTDEEVMAFRDNWRANNPEIVQFWRKLEIAAFDCINTGQDQTVGQVVFSLIKQPSRDSQCMTMLLPSGRKLVYWDVSIKPGELPWGDIKNQVHYWSENALTRKWAEGKIYGGLLTENLVQATSRDLMADILLRAEHLNPVLTVHDEVVCEVTKDHPDPTSELLSIMRTAPVWAENLPIDAEVSAAERYMK